MLMPGKPKFPLYGFYFGSDHTKIFRDDRQIAKLIPQNLEIIFGLVL